MDFTYLYIKGGKVRYNCTIRDLYDRSVIATVNEDNITTKLTMRALFVQLSGIDRPKSSFFIVIEVASLLREKLFGFARSALFNKA